MLQEFTKETGIKVDLQIMDWEPLLDKIVTAYAAGVAPADVTEMNWDWVGKFGAAGWCEPLNDHFTSEFFEDISTKDLFKYKDQYIAIPIYNDFRVTYINKDYYQQAGIQEMPKTPDELMQNTITIKAKGVCEYPLMVPFTATGATTTPWYLLTKAYGGELLGKNNEPLFAAKDSAGYKAMEFLIKGLKDYKVIDPASVGWKGTDVVDNFKAGSGAIDLAGWAGNVSAYSNPKEYKIADSVQVIKVPGLNGNSRTYGLQEGLASPGMVAVAVLTFLSAWSQFVIPLIFAPQNAKPLTVLITQFVGRTSIDYGLMSAAGNITILPPLLLVIFLSKFLVNGLMQGAVKS